MSLKRQFRFSWPAVVDPEGDPVQYEGEYRKDAGAWTSLFALQSGTSYNWDTVDLAAGLYEVRVRANDGFVYGDWAVSAVFVVHLYGLIVYRLRIRNAADDGDELVISSLPGDARLCLMGPPYGDGQEFDPISGNATIGAYTVEATDRLIGVDQWAITEKVFDAEARQQLLSRKAFLEISRDTGASWQTLAPGYCTYYDKVGALKWVFTVGAARRIEQERRVFQKVTATFPNITALIGGPTRSWWGPLFNYPVPWVFEVIAKDADTVSLQMVDGWALDNADFGGQLGRHLTIAGIYARERANQLALPEFVRTSTTATSGRFPGIDVEVGEEGTFHPVAQQGEQLDGLPYLIGNRGIIILEWDTAQPDIGDQFPVTGWRTTIADDNPLHFRGHPVDFVAAVLTDIGVPFDTASRDAVKAALGPDLAAMLRITGPELASTAIGWMTGLCGFSLRFNSLGEREFFETRVRNITTPSTTITLDELRRVDAPIFQMEEKLMRNMLTIQVQRFLRWTPEIGVARTADDVVPMPRQIGPFDNGQTDAYGEHEQLYAIPGCIMVGTSGVEYGDGFFEDGLAQELFDRFGRGGQVADLYVTTAISEVIGEEIVLNLPHLPVAGGMGGIRVVQILRRTETPGGAVLHVLDTGEDAQPATTPTFTLDKADVDPRKYGELTITNAATLNAAGIRVRIEWAFGASEPTGGGAFLTEYAAGEIPTGPIVLPPLDAGTHIWMRMQSFQQDKRAGPYTDWDDVDLDDLDPPTDIVFTPGVDGDDTVDLSFAIVETDMPHEVYMRLDGSDPSTARLIALLPPGSSALSGVPVELAVAYTFGVRAVELPPWQGVSTTREEDFTAGSTPTDLDPPNLDNIPLVGGGSVQPVENWANQFKNFDGVGGTRALPGYSSWRIHPTASVTGFAASAPIEIWIAYETFIGSGIFGAYELHYPTTNTVPPTTYPYPPTDPGVGRSPSGWTVTPYDALLIRVKCRHAIPGGAVSAFSAEQEFTRELLLPPPPDFVPGIDPSTTGPGVLYQVSAGAPIATETQTATERGGTGSDLSATGPGLLFQSALGADVSVGFSLPAGTYDYAADSVLRPSSDNNAGNTLGDATHRWFDIQAMTAVLATSLGVGLAAPTGVRVYASDGNAMAAALTTTDRIIISEQGAAAGMSIVVASATAGHRAVYKGVRAGGTLGTPLVPNLNDDVLTFLGAIYDGTDTEGTAGIFFKVDGAVSNNVAPQRISFVTSATDAASRVERVTIGSTGLMTAIYGLAITSGQTLSWTADNAAGSIIGATATTGRPFGAYIGTELVVGTDPGSAIITGLTTNFKSRLQGGMITEGGAAFGVAVVTYGATPNFFGVRFNGTKGAETGIVSGNILLNLVGVGYDTTGPSGGTGSQFRAQSTETWSATAHGAGLGFVTVANTTTTATVRWTINHDGMFYPGNFGTAADNVYDVGLTTSRPRTVYGYTGNFTTTVTTATLVGTTRVTSPLIGTTTNVDVVIDRNSVAQLTLGSLAASFAGILAVGGATVANVVLFSRGTLTASSTTARGIRDGVSLVSAAAGDTLIGVEAGASFTADTGDTNVIAYSVRCVPGGVTTTGGGTFAAYYGVKVENVPLGFAGITWDFYGDAKSQFGSVVIGAATGGDKGAGTLNLDNALYRDGTQVVSTRVAGYTAFTGTNTNRGTAYDTATITLVQLAERVRALQVDLTAHGLIGA